MIDLLSAEIAQAKGSLLVLADVDKEWPQASRPLTVDHKGELKVAHARRRGNGLRAGMMGVVAEDDRLTLARPSAVEIGIMAPCQADPRANAKARFLMYVSSSCFAGTS